jgi:ketosteroid isomerase-like protein
MTTTTRKHTTFDFARLRRAVEERDASSQLRFYADDAEVRIVDRDHPPRAPRVLRGKDAVREWIEDISARDMTHRVEHEVLGDGRAAFTEACRYPDGTNVLCSAVLRLRDGEITQALVIQVWDE